MIEKLEELEKICDFLKKQCHSEGCRDIYRCPRQYQDYLSQLDIYTALLWELSIIIQRFCLSSNFHYHREVRRDFNTLRYVLSYHDKKYEEVYNHISCASLIMLKIIMAEEGLE